MSIRLPRNSSSNSPLNKRVIHINQQSQDNKYCSNRIRYSNDSLFNHCYEL